MPMRRRASRSSARDSFTKFFDSKTISPEVGSTRRLMQRIRVDFPVPEGPMTALMPRGANSRSMPRSTGLPRSYSLTSCLMTRAGAARDPALTAAACSAATGPTPLFLLRLLRRGLGLSLREVVERCLVELLAAAFRDLPHERPVLLVGDREEAVGAV